MHLTASERIIVHIADYWRVAEPVEELTQKGISLAVELRRSHVPRNLKRLIAEGQIVEAEGRIGGRGRRVRYYRITEAGLRRAREIRDGLLAEKVLHAGHEDTIEQISKQFSLSPLQVALRTDESRTFRPPTAELAVHPGLIERDGDLALMGKWHREGGPVMVVYGAAGMGKTALGRAFIAQLRRRVIWIDVREGEERSNLVLDLCDALTVPKGDAEGTRIIEKLRSEGILAVLDGYGVVSEEVVDYLAAMQSGLKGSDGKLVVLAQETTPSYCRFYSHDSVKKGDVWELHLKGLSLQGCRKMLGAEGIDDEALKRIYLLTKGTPLYLDQIRRGDIDGLRKRSRFTSAEIRLLIFSRDVAARR